MRPRDPDMRILFVGKLGAHQTSAHRMQAMVRLGHQAVGFDTTVYASCGGALASRVRLRTLVGRAVSRLNADLLEAARRGGSDLVWFDKATYVRPGTIRALRAAGIYTVHHNLDNPFGPRRDPGWRLILDALPDYDLHVVPRACNLQDYRQAGARDVVLMPFAFEPGLQFPPPHDWSDRDRINEVVFIGSPYDDRAAFLTELWRRHGIAVRIWGTSRWRSALDSAAYAALVQGTELWDDDYRIGIWRSRICLSFVTHSNCDDVAHKSFEIAGSGGFLLAEDTPGQRAAFVDGEEAVLFRRPADCADRIRRYLPDEAARRRIAAAGRQRAVASGYSNDARIALVLDHVRHRMAPAAA